MATPQEDPLWGYYSAVAGQNNTIDALELQQALTASGIHGAYRQFSADTCQLMIRMLDRDYSGTMGFAEFKELWQALNQWKTTFLEFDADRSGAIEPQELQQALIAFGYNLSPQAISIIIKRYSYGAMGKISFDHFISACVRMRGLTDQFRRRDASNSGNASLGYDDFMQVTMFF